MLFVNKVFRVLLRFAIVARHLSTSKKVKWFIIALQGMQC
jgi:hypothetical protein